MRCYTFGSATHAAEVMGFFASGVKGELIREGNRYTGGDVALWGLLRGAKELRQKVKEASSNYYAVDHAYIGRRDFYRVTRNGFQQTEIFDRPKDRWRLLVGKYRIEVKPWRRGGSYVLVPLSSSMNYEYFGQVGWEHYITREIKQFTDRPIVIRKKSEDNLQEQLRKAWCVVTHTSMVAVDAVLAGVPVFTTGPSIARPMGLSDLRRLEDPIFPDRTAWCHSLAYAQFSEKDMKHGIVIKTLDEYPVNYSHYGL